MHLKFRRILPERMRLLWKQHIRLHERRWWELSRCCCSLLLLLLLLHHHLHLFLREKLLMLRENHLLLLLVMQFDFFSWCIRFVRVECTTLIVNRSLYHIVSLSDLIERPIEFHIACFQIRFTKRREVLVVQALIDCPSFFRIERKHLVE